MNTTDFDLILYQQERVGNRYSQNFSKAETRNNQMFGVRKTTCRASRQHTSIFFKNASVFRLKRRSVLSEMSKRFSNPLIIGRYWNYLHFFRNFRLAENETFKMNIPHEVPTWIDVLSWTVQRIRIHLPFPYHRTSYGNFIVTDWYTSSLNFMIFWNQV